MVNENLSSVSLPHQQKAEENAGGHFDVDVVPISAQAHAEAFQLRQFSL